jgi:uncharacterized protein involved in exopolysaccharide biosynthesis
VTYSIRESRETAFEWLLRRRFLTALMVFGIPLLVLAFTAVLPRKYVSDSSFTAQAGRTSSNIGGIAAQLGLSTGSSDAFQNPAFYAALLQSRQLLDHALDTQVEIDGRRVSVLSHIDAAARSRVDRERARKKLASDVKVATDTKTGLIHLTVASDDARVAAAANSGLLQNLNQVNLDMRHASATAERKFAEQRLQEARAELRGAEGALASFLRSNRDYGGSPDLRVEYERLNREVSIDQQLFLTVAQAQEQARVEEERDTPVITVVEPPEVPLSPAPRMLAFRAVAALALGVFVAFLLALWSTAWRPILRSKLDSTDERRARPTVSGQPRSGLARLAGGLGITSDRIND